MKTWTLRSLWVTSEWNYSKESDTSIWYFQLRKGIPNFQEQTNFYVYLKVSVFSFFILGDIIFIFLIFIF